MSRAAPTISSSPSDTTIDAPFEFIADASGDIRWQLRTDGWRLTSPILARSDQSTASFESVVDTYVGLLSAFARAGYPLNNSVSFTPASFIRGLGWVARTARAAPTGKQYRQLDLALDHLRHASIESEAIRERLEAILGKRVLQANFAVLQSWMKVAGSTTVGGTVRVEAQFSDHFAALLRRDAAVEYCAQTYMRLPRGVTRALYRYIAGLRAADNGPTATVPAMRVLAHLGSRRRDLEPSRMKAILCEPHIALAAEGVLGGPPVWSKSESGETQLTYVLRAAPDITVLLEETALAYGVTDASAREWASSKTDTLARVLAAAVEGRITPTQNIARMVYNYVDSGRLIDPAALPHFDPKQGITTPKHRCQEFEYLESNYNDTTRWLGNRPVVEDALRRKYSSLGHPGWVCNGLVLLAAARLRESDSVTVWRRRVNDWS